MRNQPLAPPSSSASAPVIRHSDCRKSAAPSINPRARKHRQRQPCLQRRGPVAPVSSGGTPTVTSRSPRSLSHCSSRAPGGGGCPGGPGPRHWPSSSRPHPPSRPSAPDHGDRIRDPKRVAPPPPARGGDAPDRVGGADRHPVHPARRGARRRSAAPRPGERDVAAVVGIGAGDAGARPARPAPPRPPPRHGGHRGDEGRAERGDGAAMRRAMVPCTGGRGTQGRKFGHQFVQHRGEARGRAGMGGADRGGSPTASATMSMQARAAGAAARPAKGPRWPKGAGGGQGHGSTLAAVGYSPPSAMTGPACGSPPHARPSPDSRPAAG
jgi:translation initiation factor IF-2